MSEIIPLGSWVDHGVHYLLDHDAKTFDSIGKVIETFAAAVEHSLQAVPMWALMAIFVGIGLWRVGWRFAVFVLASLLLIYATNFWDQMVITLGLTLSSTVISLLLGIPLGIWTSKSKYVEMAVRPVLDLMQTMPAFVYLIPAVILFGLGRVPAVIATIVFAMPPVVRLTTLGIKQVREELMEAGRSFGSTDTQLLWKIQLPNALPSIMAGINQTIMMALSMVVVASMIGAGGLGEYVLSGIQRLDIGIGFEGGLGVVLLAIVLDRLTESFGVKARKAKRNAPAKAGTGTAVRT
jgi:glycine betaine/proline transport system permease protein